MEKHVYIVLHIAKHCNITPYANASTPGIDTEIRRIVPLPDARRLWGNATGQHASLSAFSEVLAVGAKGKLRQHTVSSCQ